MTTVYPVSMQDTTKLTHYDAPEIDMESIERIAQYCVNEICRKWSITGALYSEHRDDMRQTAITTVYEEKVVKNAPDLFIFQNARWALEDYIWRLILGRGKGHQWEKSRDVHIEYGYDESYEGEEGSPVASVMRKVSHHRSQQIGGYCNQRPVEERLIVKEAMGEDAAMFAEFEQELARILAALAGRQLQPQTILNRARLMREVLEGETAGTLSHRNGVASHLMAGRISNVRADIKKFLAQSPVLQGVTRANGEVLVQWHDEVTKAMLNSGQRFIVVLPYGAFTVSLKRDRRSDNHSIQVQAGRRVNGKPVNRSCSLGKQGGATYESLFAATHALSRKMDVLHVLADASLSC